MIGTMNDDGDLLRQFVEDRSEAAFGELVSRHLDLVYSVALRQTDRDHSLAAEAAQAVFCELARSAARLSGRGSLSGWLYNTTRFVASRMRRSESRRAVRDLRFFMRHERTSEQSVGWSDVESLLDDAMQALSEADREAVILRYFRDEPFGSIGAALGLSENAARMRVERALERLRAILSRRGIVCPSSLLGSLLVANAISAAPAGLAAGILMNGLATTSVAATAGAATLLSVMNTSKTVIASAAMLVGVTSTGWIFSQRQGGQLKTELAELRSRPADIPSGQDGAASKIDPAELARLRAEHSELMRLRAEVTQLRREQRERAAAPPTPVAAPPGPAPRPPAQFSEERLQELGMAKLALANAWGVAFFKFAQENEGQLPADFETAANYLPRIPETALQFEEVASNNFEIVYRGSLKDIANPSQAVILRERDPYGQPDGSAQRTYLFADGHTEIYRSPTGVFEAWEKQRQPILKGTPVPQ